MSRIRNRDTKPELLVRSIVHRLGYRFRLHKPKLPGHPDVILSRLRKLIFVHGCFWHGHPGCSRATIPATNVAFWEQKIGRTLERDRENQALLRDLGWDILVVWQCETKDVEHLTDRLKQFLEERDA